MIEEVIDPGHLSIPKCLDNYALARLVHSDVEQISIATRQS
jgi:hypothetical protein